MRKGLISICIIVCGAFGCQGGGDVKDAGTDAIDAGECGAGWTIWEECVDGHHQWIRIRPDCSEDRGDSWCYIGCDVDGVGCVPVP